MIKTVSSLISGSWLNGWDGKQKSYIKSSNKLIKALYEEGIDSLLNSVVVKLVFQYDRQRFNKALVEGIEFNYQNHTILLIQVKNRIQVTLVFNSPNNGLSTVVFIEYLSKNLIKNLRYEMKVNNDISDILNGLLDKGVK